MNGSEKKTNHWRQWLHTPGLGKALACVLHVHQRKTPDENETKLEILRRIGNVDIERTP